MKMKVPRFCFNSQSKITKLPSVLHFLCVSDLHGDRVDCSKFTSTPDAIFLLGDNGRDAIEELLDHFKGIPVFGVAGNHDTKEIYKRLPVTDVHGRVEKCKGMEIAGLAGCLWYKSGPWLFSEKQVERILKRVPRVNIFLSHSPPAKTIGESQDTFESIDGGPHSGFQALTKYIAHKPPAILLHGHLHRSDWYFYGNTLFKGVLGAEMIALNNIDHHFAEATVSATVNLSGI